jgi:hypothetical protein
VNEDFIDFFNFLSLPAPKSGGRRARKKGSKKKTRRERKSFSLSGRKSDSEDGAEEKSFLCRRKEAGREENLSFLGKSIFFSIQNEVAG